MQYTKLLHWEKKKTQTHAFNETSLIIIDSTKLGDQIKTKHCNDLKSNFIFNANKKKKHRNNSWFYESIKLHFGHTLCKVGSTNKFSHLNWFLDNIWLCSKNKKKKNERENRKENDCKEKREKKLKFRRWYFLCFMKYLPGIKALGKKY